MLELRTFGGLSLKDGGAPITGAATQRKTLALLALLAAAGKNGLSRDKLIAYLWPETDTEHGRNLLNQACYALRRDLREREALLGTSELRLNPNVVRSDLEAFEAALQRGDSGGPVVNRQGKVVGMAFAVDTTRPHTAYALGNAISKLSKIQVPQRPRTTYNVGVIGGGTSVNSIPFESWMDVDIRSETKEELNKVVETFTRMMHEAVDEENRARSTSQGRIEVDVKLIGDRPFGEVSQSSPIVQTASAVIRAFGLSPVYGMSSTDANIPMSMGIPAITLESGGTGSRNHTLDEWIDVEKTASVRGIQIAMGILLSLAGMF